MRVRSRIKIFEQDENNTAFIFGRIKAQNKVNNIQSVRDDEAGVSGSTKYYRNI